MRPIPWRLLNGWSGDLALAATYYDRWLTEVIISSEHADNFVKDMLTMKARKRVALAVKRQGAMVTGDFTFGLILNTQSTRPDLLAGLFPGAAA